MNYKNIPVGTKIKALDFPSISDRPDQYIVGEILETVDRDYGKAYLVLASEDSSGLNRIHVYVPVECFIEFDNRIEVLS